MTRQEHTQIFAERLNMLKNDHDLTYRDIERQTGIRHNQLGEWTKGKSVANGWGIFRLSEFFGVSADWLLGLSDTWGGHRHEERNRRIRRNPQIESASYRD